MSFNEYDLTDYIEALEDFKNNNPDRIIKHWGNVEHFDELIEQKLKGTEEIMAQSDNLYRNSTSDIEKDVSSDEIQSIV